MKVACPECGRELKSEVRAVGSFRHVVHYREDGEEVEHCPNCGTKLDGNSVKPPGSRRNG